jgi:uncharacterized protein YkwD
MRDWHALRMQRSHHQRVAALLWLVLLQACGGGGGDDTSRANTPAATSNTPTAPAAAASAPSGSAPAAADITCGLANFEADALRLINQYRAAGATCGSHGAFAPAAALTRNAKLDSAAFGHSRDMADHNYFSHDSQDGRTMPNRIDATGYTWSTIGENIAAGYSSVQSVIDGWMASEGHCANLMNPRFTEFGMACARNDASTYRLYWTQDFGRP